MENTKMSRHIHRSYGFTLLEVMFAIVLLSMGLISVANMQIIAFQVGTSSSKLTQATTATQETIEALMSIDLRDKNLEDNTDSGIYTEYIVSEETLHFSPPPGIQVRWQVDEQIDGSKAVNVITTWTSSDSEKNISLPLIRTQFQ